MQSVAMAGHCCWCVRFPAPGNNGLKKAASARSRITYECLLMSLVYAFAASAMEAQPIRRMGVPGLNSTFRCGPNDVVVVMGGMGPLNARMKADVAFRPPFSAFAGSKPDAALVIGLCGGLTNSLPENRIVAYTECRSVERDKPTLRCPEKMVEAITGVLKPANILCDRVIGITSPGIATTPAQRATLAQIGATVVDMESYSVLGAAAAAGIPAAVLRVVSDAVDRELPDFNRALDDSGAIDGRKALRVALGSPLRTLKLVTGNRS